MTATVPFSPQPTCRPAAPPLPDWLADEALLADEAVLFGLSDARLDDRIALIRLTFAERTALIEKQIEYVHKQLGDLNQAIDNAETALKATQSQPYVPAPGQWSTSSGWQLAAQTGLMLAGSVGVFWGSEWAGARPVLSTLVAGLMGLSGCAGSLIRYWFAQKQQLAQAQHTRQRDAENGALLSKNLADYQAVKQKLVADLYRIEAERNLEQAHRDRLIRLFDSEFDLARSLRYSLQPTEAYQ